MHDYGGPRPLCMILWSSNGEGVSTGGSSVPDAASQSMPANDVGLSVLEVATPSDFMPSLLEVDGTQDVGEDEGPQPSAQTIVR